MGKLSGSLLVCALLCACGGSSSSDIAGTSPGGDAGTSSATVYTLDNVCDLTSPKICDLRKPCCEATFGYDEAVCRAQANADCAKDVAEVRAGRETFFPERIDPCLQKFEGLFRSCRLDVNVLFEASALADCRIFEGTLPVGAKCERDAQCASSKESPDAFVDCDDDTSTCKSTRLFNEGETCSWTGEPRGFCNKGLACDAPVIKGAQGTCKKATALGATCDAKAPLTTECGLGAYCDKTSGTCIEAKDEGATCQTGLECRSIDCPSEGTDKTCQPAKPLVKADECK